MDGGVRRRVKESRQRVLEMVDRLFTEAATRLLLIALPEVDAESDDWSRLLCHCVTHKIFCVAQ